MADTDSDRKAGEPGGRAGLKIHHLRPGAGRAHRAYPGRPRRGIQGQDRRPRHQGQQGPQPGIPECFEGGQMPLHRRLPKLKGFSNPRFKTTYQVVNLDRLAALYPDGGAVTPENLAAKGAVRPGELVKVLGQGEIDGGAAGQRARVLGVGAGQDHRSGRNRYRTVR